MSNNFLEKYHFYTNQYTARCLHKYNIKRCGNKPSFVAELSSSVYLEGKAQTWLMMSLSCQAQLDLDS